MEQQIEHRNQLSKFFEKEYNKLVLYVRNLVYNRLTMDAEDIVQEVAMNMFSRASYSESPENVAGYVYRSLRNKIIDIQRKKELPKYNIDSKTETEDGYIIKEIPEQEKESPNILLDEKMQYKMMKTLEKLNPDEQMVIIATEFEGYSFKELSSETGISVGTLLARKHRGLAKLSKLMQENLENSEF